MTVASGLIKVGKGMKKKVKSFLNMKEELATLMKEDYPSPRQLEKIEKLKKEIKAFKKSDENKEMLSRAKRSGQRKKLKGKGVDMSMAGPLNRGGMLKKKKAYAAGGVAKKIKVGSMDYRKGGLFK